MACDDDGAGADRPRRERPAKRHEPVGIAAVSVVEHGIDAGQPVQRLLCHHALAGPCLGRDDDHAARAEDRRDPLRDRGARHHPALLESAHGETVRETEDRFIAVCGDLRLTPLG